MKRILLFCFLLITLTDTLTGCSFWWRSSYIEESKGVEDIKKMATQQPFEAISVSNNSLSQNFRNLDLYTIDLCPVGFSNVSILEKSVDQAFSEGELDQKTKSWIINQVVFIYNPGLDYDRVAREISGHNPDHVFQVLAAVYQKSPEITVGVICHYDYLEYVPERFLLGIEGKIVSSQATMSFINPHNNSLGIIITQNNLLFLSSAGNGGPNQEMRFPASLPSVICVSGYAHEDTDALLAEDASYIVDNSTLRPHRGSALCQDKEYAIVEDPYVLINEGVIWGTSMATAKAAAKLAKLLKRGGYGVDDLRQMISQESCKSGTVGPWRSVYWKNYGCLIH